LISYGGIKSTVLTVLLIITPLLVRSQEIGVLATSNGSDYEGDRPSGVRTVPDFGYAVGIYFDYPVAEGVTAGLQVGYQATRTIVRVRDLNNPGQLKDTLDFRVNFLSLPLRVKISPVKSPKVYFVSDLMFNIELESETVDENGNELNMDDLLKDLSLAMGFGIGYRFPIKSTILSLELKFVQGITNLGFYEESGILFSRVRTRGMHFTASFGLPLRKQTSKENQR